MSEKRITFRLAAYTDPAGKWSETAPKKGNEDDLFVDSDLSAEVQGSFVADKETSLSDAGCLMVVADGMGGMNAGEVASAIAVETVRAAFEGKNLTSEILATSASRVRYMENIVVRADAAVKKRSKEDQSCEGMGSTLIMAWLYGNELSVTWCGDSRAYLFRESAGIRQISKDHSYVQSLVDKGDITEVEAFDHPYGNIITRNLGDPEKKAAPDSVTLPVYKGDVILVCSDGLSGVLRDRKSYDREGNLIPGDNLEDIIRCNRRTMTSCREALWAAAEAADWYDNVTAVLCEITDGEDASVASGARQEDGMNRSFISIRLSKKALRTILIVFSVVVLCAVAWLVLCMIRPLHSAKEDFMRIRDSLERVADSTDMIYVQNLLMSVSDSLGVDKLLYVGKELEMRLGMKAELDTLRSLAKETGRDEEARKITAAIDSVKKAASPVIDIEALRVAVSLERKSPSARIQRQQDSLEAARLAAKQAEERRLAEERARQEAAERQHGRLTEAEENLRLTVVEDTSETDSLQLTEVNDTVEVAIDSTGLKILKDSTSTEPILNALQDDGTSI